MIEKIVSIIKQVIVLPMRALLWIIIVSIVAFAVAFFGGTDLIPFWDTISSETALSYLLFVNKMANIMYGVIGIYIVICATQDGVVALQRNIKALVLMLYLGSIYHGIVSLTKPDDFWSIFPMQMVFLGVIIVVICVKENGRRYSSQWSDWQQWLYRGMTWLCYFLMAIVLKKIVFLTLPSENILCFLNI